MLVLYLAGVALCIAGLTALGVRARGTLGVLLCVQASYMALDYLVRPLLLVLVEPAPRPNDPFADPRLVALGYRDAITRIAGLVLLGLLAYLATLRVVRPMRGREVSRIAVPTSHAVVVLLGAWAFRLLYYFGLRSSAIETLTYVGSIAAGTAVLYSHRRLRPPALAALFASELLWSALYQAKTPILALVLWILLAQVRHAGRLRLRRLLPLAAAGTAAFLSIQFVKIAAGRLASTETYQAAYPAMIRPSLVLMQRFDGVSSMTDAVSAGARSWMTPLDAFWTFCNSLIPRFLLASGKSDLSGLRWAAEVRRQSLPASRPVANLAEGPFAEGYVIGGTTGVVVEAVLLALITFGVARLLTSDKRFYAMMGLAMTSQPLLFERGLLGIGEGIGKGLQVALVTAAALSMLGLVKGDAVTRRTPQQAAPGSAAY